MSSRHWKVFRGCLACAASTTRPALPIVAFLIKTLASVFRPVVLSRGVLPLGPERFMDAGALLRPSSGLLETGWLSSKCRHRASTPGGVMANSIVLPLSPVLGRQARCEESSHAIPRHSGRPALLPARRSATDASNMAARMPQRGAGLAEDVRVRLYRHGREMTTGMGCPAIAFVTRLGC